METLVLTNYMVSKYHIPVFWDDEFKRLNYIHENFPDPENLALWASQGYQSKVAGDLCDMRHHLPSWANNFIKIYTGLGWKDVGLGFYRMTTDTVIPLHQDLYNRYIQLFDLTGKEQTIRRAIVLLEDWHPGHYLEVAGIPYVNWMAGDVVEWEYDTPHSSANIGVDTRYTLQITGHL